MSGPVAPRPVLVPDEIVQHRHLHRNRRGEEIVQVEPVHEEGHHSELYRDAHQPHAIERQPPPRRDLCHPCPVMCRKRALRGSESAVCRAGIERRTIDRA